MRVDKGRNQRQRRLTEAEIAYIKRAYDMNVSAIEVAKIFDLSERCVRDRYQRFRGYALSPRQLEKTLSARRKSRSLESKPEPTPKPKRLNEARFYHSDFIPS